LYTDADYYSEETKIKNLQNQNGGLTPYWKSVFWRYLRSVLSDLL